MKNVSKNVKAVKATPRFVSALWLASFVVPFIGVAMIMNCEGGAFAFGIVLLALGLFTWTINWDLLSKPTR